MKRIAVSAGLVALGVATVQASPAYGLNSMQSSKPWSVEARLRGFYDDNVALSANDEEGSFGFDLSPSVSINLPLEQTLFTAGYIYTYRYYDDDGSPEGDSRCEQIHQFDLSLVHNFSERYMLELRNSFVYAEEPGLVDPASTFPGRAQAIRNFGSIKLSIEMTRTVGLVLGYRNAYYNYEDDGLSSFLDRMEHAANIDLRWRATHSTTAVFGYEFGAVGYLEDDALGGGFTSEDRNNYSHKLYVGADHTFNPSFQGSVRAGVQIVDYYNASGGNADDVTPWGQASLTYTYSAEGNARFGFSHTRNQTDITSITGSDITQDQQVSSAYFTVSHNITPKLNGSVTGRYVHATFNGGDVDGDTDSLFGAALNLTYSFNEHLAAEAGYNYDVLCSDISGREYSRNRFYLGLSAAY